MKLFMNAKMSQVQESREEIGLNSSAEEACKARFIGVSHIDIVDDTQPAPKENKKPDRGAFLDKQATKELPGTMEDLRREANEASRLHMSYGQYQVMKQREWENRHGFGFGHAGIR